MIINFMTTNVRKHVLLHIQKEAVEIVENLKFLGVTIPDQLTLSINIPQLVKKAISLALFP